MRSAAVWASLVLAGCAAAHVPGGTHCAVAADAPDAGSHVRAGSCWEAAARRDLAQTEYRRALARDPHNLEARGRLARGYLAQGEEVFAAREFLLLVQDDPGNSDAIFILGGLLSRAGRADLAVASFLRVLEIDPGHARAAYNLGALYAAREDTARAKKYFLSYLRLAPGSPEEPAIHEWMTSHGHDTDTSHEPSRPPGAPVP